MTSRRGVASFTFLADGGTDDNNRASDLERKLELLEARFTMPLQFQSKSHPNNSNNSNSPATLDAENSSPVSVQSSTMHEQSHQYRNNDSQQSFTFDTPSLLNMEEKNRNRSMGNADHIPHRWEEIASAHVARVQQLHECNDSQQNTIHTSHVKEHPSSVSPMRTTVMIGVGKDFQGGEENDVQSSPPPLAVLASPTVKNKNSIKHVSVRYIDATVTERFSYVFRNFSTIRSAFFDSSLPTLATTTLWRNTRRTQKKAHLARETIATFD